MPLFLPHAIYRFDHWMAVVNQHYYNQLDGIGQDFTTAPELTPAFAATVAQWMLGHWPQLPAIAEYGPGSGRMAEVILRCCQAQGLEPPYFLVETSAGLTEAQRRRLASYPKAQWVPRLPSGFSGVVLAHEFVDALPVRRVRYWQGQWQEAFVQQQQGQWQWLWQAAPQDLAQLAMQRIGPLEGYESEINLAAENWIQELAHGLGPALVWICDYGFAQREYFHPQRSSGTLVRHQRHRMDEQVLADAGSADLTAHVDFSALCAAASGMGLKARSYGSLAGFLLAHGLDQHVDEHSTPAQRQALATLVHPAEMGELFKVLVLSHAFDAPLSAGLDQRLGSL